MKRPTRTAIAFDKNTKRFFSFSMHHTIDSNLSVSSIAPKSANNISLTHNNTPENSKGNRLNVQRLENNLPVELRLLKQHLGYQPGVCLAFRSSLGKKVTPKKLA
jgi:hypothetical protein